MGLLQNPTRGRLLTRRGAVLGVVAALHVVALLIAVRSRVQVEVAPTATLMHMDIVQDVVTPVKPPTLQPPPMVQVVIPRISIPDVEFPAPQAITLPPATAQVAASPSAAPAPVQDAAPVMLDVNEVEYLRKPAAPYPRAAQRARLQGTVLVWVLIDPQGHPQNVRVHRSSGHEVLDRAGCDAVSHALFKPYRANGVALSAQVIVPIQFGLDSRTASRN